MMRWLLHLDWRSLDSEKHEARGWCARYSIQIAKHFFFIGLGMSVFLYSIKLSPVFPDVVLFFVFLPAWIATSLCCFVLPFSWYLTRPYVYLCLSGNHTPNSRENSPSVLYDVFSEFAVASVGSAQFLMLLFLEIILYFVIVTNSEQALSFLGIFISCIISLTLLLYGIVFNYLHCYESVFFGLSGCLLTLITVARHSLPIKISLCLAVLSLLTLAFGITAGRIYYYAKVHELLTEVESFSFGIQLASLVVLDSLWLLGFFKILIVDNKLLNLLTIDTFGFHFLITMAIVVCTSVANIRSELRAGPIERRLEKQYATVFSKAIGQPGTYFDESSQAIIICHQNYSSRWLQVLGNMKDMFFGSTRYLASHKNQHLPRFSRQQPPPENLFSNVEMYERR